jgi:uncharacterized protein (DUF433 family)
MPLCQSAHHSTSKNDRIVADPAILVGKPVVRGTRLSVEFLLGLMADGWGEVDKVDTYPGLAHEDLAACRMFRM